jgi:hypothetical protein
MSFQQLDLSGTIPLLSGRQFNDQFVHLTGDAEFSLLLADGLPIVVDAHHRPAVSLSLRHVLLD